MLPPLNPPKFSPSDPDPERYSKYWPIAPPPSLRTTRSTISLSRSTIVSLTSSSSTYRKRERTSSTASPPRGDARLTAYARERAWDCSCSRVCSHNLLCEDCSRSLCARIEGKGEEDDATACGFTLADADIYTEKDALARAKAKAKANMQESATAPVFDPSSRREPTISPFSKPEPEPRKPRLITRISKLHSLLISLCQGRTQTKSSQKKNKIDGKLESRALGVPTSSHATHQLYPTPSLSGRHHLCRPSCVHCAAYFSRLFAWEPNLFPCGRYFCVACSEALIALYPGVPCEEFEAWAESPCGSAYCEGAAWHVSCFPKL